jgi:hypothetical protein
VIDKKGEPFRSTWLLLGFLFFSLGCNRALEIGGDGGAVDLLSSTGRFFDPNGKHGVVDLLSGSYKQGASSYSETKVSASFTEISGAPVCFCSGVSVIGPCTVFAGCAPCGPVPMGTPESAGNLVITGGKKPISLTPPYAPFSDLMNTLWLGGETLTISAQGDVVPSFSGTLVAPTSFALTTPDVSAATTPIPLSKDLLLTWTGGGSAEVTVNFVAIEPSLLCSFPAGPGQAVIPHEVFGNYSPNTTAELSVGVSATASIAVSDWSILVSAGVPPTQAGQDLNFENIVFE